MARARNIKPGFYKNEDLAECTIWARYIYPGLWMLADREGRLEDRPKRIKGELIPFDSVDVEPLLHELATKLDAKGDPFIIRYQVDGARYIQIVKFNDHQTPHYSEKKSEIPAPGDCAAVQPQRRCTKLAAKTLYFVRCGEEGPIKIGVTESDRVALRMRELAAGNPFSLSLLATAPQTDGFTEAALHERFSASRMAGEWFKATDDLLGLIEEISKKYPVINTTEEPGNDEPSSSASSKNEHLIKRGSQPPDSLIPDSLIPDSGGSARSPKARKASFDPLTCTLPGWLPLESWKEFSLHRKEMKSPLTELATRKTLKALSIMREAGHDPVAVLEQSIANGWIGIFEPKNVPRGTSNGRHPPASASDRSIDLEHDL